MLKIIDRVLIFVVGCLAVGCTGAPISSQTINTRTDSRASHLGSYYLPIGNVRIKLNRTDFLVTCALEAQISQDGSISFVKVGADARIPKAISRKFTLEYVEVRGVPDASAAYEIVYDEGAWSDDGITIDFTADGLIDKIDFKSKDRTGDVVLKIVELGKEVAKGFVSFGQADGGQGGSQSAAAAARCAYEEETPLGAEVVLDAEFDPQDTQAVSQLNRNIAAYVRDSRATAAFHALPLRVVIPEHELTVSVEVPQASSPPPNPLPSRQTGIFYRPALPVDIVFSDGQRDSYRTTVLVPNKRLVGFMDIRRAVFVEKLTMIDFDKGLLKQVQITKPSEALAIASLPVEIAKMVVAIPAELIQLKIGAVNQDKDLLNARKDLINAQKDNLAAQGALDEYIKQNRDKKLESGEPSAMSEGE